MDESDQDRKAFRISGLVQGVGFRWSTMRFAARLGLRGTVRNRVDGGVEVCVEGASKDVAELEDWLSRGPPGARVDRVEQTEPCDRVPYDDFRIEY